MCFIKEVRYHAVLWRRFVLSMFRVPKCMLLLGEGKLSALTHVCVYLFGKLHGESNMKPAMKFQCLC